MNGLLMLAHPFSPLEVIEMAISLVNKEGYKIGKARMWWPDRAEQDRGLYKPVKIQGKRVKNPTENGSLVS